MKKALTKLQNIQDLSAQDVLVGLVYLFVILLPFTYRLTIEIGFTIKPYEVVGVLGFGILLFDRLRRGDFSWKRTSLDIPLLGFWVVAALSLTQAINLERGVAWWLWLSFYIFGVYYLVVNVIKERRHIKGLLKTFIVVAFVASLFSFYQFFADYLDIPFTWLDAGYGKFGGLGYPRAQSTFKEPLLFGHYLLTPAFFMVLSFLSRKTLFFKRWVEGVFVFVFSLALWTTLSRGATVAYAGGLGVLTLGYLGFWAFNRAKFRSIFKSLKRGLFPLLVILALVYPTYQGMTWVGLRIEDLSKADPQKAQRLEDKREQAVAEKSRLSLGDPRYVNWRKAWEMFKERPFLGVGWGNFGPTVTKTPEGITGHGAVFPIVNNEPLEVAVETGVLGLLFYLGFNAVFAWVMLKGAWQSVRRGLYSWAPLFVGFLLSFLAMSAQYMTFSTIQIGHFWFVLGLGAAALKIFKSGGLQHEEISR